VGGGAGTGFTLTVVGTGNFTMVFDGPDTTAHPCSWTEPGYAFSCSVISGAVPVDGYDVTLLTALTLSGSFTDARAMSSTYALNVQCSGDDCGWAELAGYEFPCDVNFALTAAAD
jgi:hypothetical protein